MTACAATDAAAAGTGAEAADATGPPDTGAGEVGRDAGGWTDCANPVEATVMKGTNSISWVFTMIFFMLPSTCPALTGSP